MEADVGDRDGAPGSSPRIAHLLLVWKLYTNVDRRNGERVEGASERTGNAAKDEARRPAEDAKAGPRDIANLTMKSFQGWSACANTRPSKDLRCVSKVRLQGAGDSRRREGETVGLGRLSAVDGRSHEIIQLFS
jgi:hypothetical protein